MGKFGFGLFLTEEAKKGDLITGELHFVRFQFPTLTDSHLIEYLGELIYEPTFLCRECATRIFSAPLSI